MWLNLRYDIGSMFADLVPTQWGVLSRAWKLKAFQYWDDRGEIFSPATVSNSYMWQSDKLHVRLRREHQAWDRALRRRQAERRRPHCRSCGEKLVHVDRMNVRVYCDPTCQRAADRQRAVDIERASVLRGCIICGELFRVSEHAAKKTCGDSCAREKNRQRRGKNMCVV